MEFEQIIELIKTVSESNVTSFSYESGEGKTDGDTGKGLKITIKKGDRGKKTEVCVVPPVQGIQPAAVPVSVAGDDDVKTVTSPLVGTFYSAASPDDEPFVKVGDRVSKGQQLGIIEAMKLMNDIESDYDGEIIEVLVSNETMVEYGQPLFKIK